MIGRHPKIATAILTGLLILVVIVLLDASGIRRTLLIDALAGGGCALLAQLLLARLSAAS